MDKILICYFSATGKTEYYAKDMNKIIKGDLFEIEPVEKYSKEDLNWMNDNSRSSREMSDEKNRPAIKNKIENINEYNKIIIGFPIWWYTFPRIINTFIEENDLKNKEVYIYATSGGSGITPCYRAMKQQYSDLNIKDSKLINNLDDCEVFLDRIINDKK